MNDALKFIRKIFRHYGYDIKERYEYNLLPILNQYQSSQTEKLFNAQESKDNENKETVFDKLYICLRTCLRKDNYKSSQKRLTGSDHRELVLRCINSLVNSINYAIDNGCDKEFCLIVFDDHSDDENKSAIENLCKRAKCTNEIITTREFGQGSSLFQQFEYAREQDGLFYFCEDDYLHEVTAILEMQKFYEHIFEMFKIHLVIHPQEHEFLYIKAVYPSYIFLSEKRHWRTISHATHVLFTHSKVVTEYWQYFENTKHVGIKKKRRLGVESRTTNLLFNHIPGFAPIPALAAHMQTEKSTPPFFDWHDLWNKNTLG